MASLENRVLSNPLRVRILEAITTSPTSPSQLATDTGTSFAAVAYHTTVLCDAGCIHPAEAERAASSDPLYEADA